MYGAEQPRKRVCSSRTMVMKRCEDSDSAGLVSTLLTTASGHVSSRAQRTAVTVVTTLLSCPFLTPQLSPSSPVRSGDRAESNRGARMSVGNAMAP